MHGVRGGLRIEEAREASENLLLTVRELVRQLSTSAQPPTSEDLDHLVSSPACRLLIARGDDDQALGMLTLVLFRIPTGVRARIEDVVVDSAVRGQGVGGCSSARRSPSLTRPGAPTVDQTSRPTREAANRLYLKMGFVLRESNVYRITL